jgi:hypothetical protein
MADLVEITKMNLDWGLVSSQTLTPEKPGNSLDLPSGDGRANAQLQLQEKRSGPGLEESGPFHHDQHH